jgi:hypothetical protein
MKPLRDIPAVIAGFAVLVVGLGGIVMDGLFEQGCASEDLIRTPWFLLILLGFLVLTGVDPVTYILRWIGRRNGGANNG